MTTSAPAFFLRLFFPALGDPEGSPSDGTRAEVIPPGGCSYQSQYFGFLSAGEALICDNSQAELEPCLRLKSDRAQMLGTDAGAAGLQQRLHAGTLVLTPGCVPPNYPCEGSV